jgi:peptidoglycan/LPS O-acetylase OafA/YrhL
MKRYFRKTIWEFEVLRALAIIFVVLSHINSIYIGSYQEILQAISIPIGEVGNSLFFFVSGYLLYFNYGRINDLTGFYRRRIARIYPQYLLILLLFFPASEDLFINAIGLQGVLNSSNQGFWFLGAIVFYYLTYPLIVYPKRIVYLFITALTILFGMVLLHYSLNLFFIGDILYYGVFVAGIVSAQESRYLDAFYDSFTNHMFSIYSLLLLFAAFAAALRYWKLTYVVASPVVMSMLFVLISITGSIVAYYSIRSYGHLLMKVRTVITNIAYCSYSIYLVHGTIISGMASILIGIHVVGIVYYILIIAVFFISLLAFFLVGYCMQKIQDYGNHVYPA